MGSSNLTYPPEVIQNVQQVKSQSPTDHIIHQVRDLILSAQLKPGDKIPSERKLAETFGVSRGNLRIAIQKLEFYGILKTLPQRGTVVASIGVTALEGLISDVLKIEDNDFVSLVETRILLECEAARLAALKRTDEDIQSIEEALEGHDEKAKLGLEAVEEDLLFHIKIAEASKNSVLKSMMVIITPDII